jgi:PPOX class probable F420-dependent enzyme
MLNAAARALLESDALAHYVTLNADGSPQVSCVWVGLEGDEIVLASLPKRIKVTNVERDPRVSLSIQSLTRNERGLDEYLVVHGHARVTEGGAPVLLQQLAHVYIGPDAVFPAPGSPPGYLTHITIDKISGVGNWTD